MAPRCLAVGPRRGRYRRPRPALRHHGCHICPILAPEGGEGRCVEYVKIAFPFGLWWLTALFGPVGAPTIQRQNYAHASNFLPRMKYFKCKYFKCIVQTAPVWCLFCAWGFKCIRPKLCAQHINFPDSARRRRQGNIMVLVASVVFVASPAEPDLR